MVMMHCKRTVRRKARFVMTAGALVVGTSVLAGCSVFDEEPTGESGVTGPAEPARVRTGEGVPRGLTGDVANRAYDESLGRRSVTTVRPLEEAVQPAPDPEPEAAPDGSGAAAPAASPDAGPEPSAMTSAPEPDIAAAPLAPVEAAEPAPAPQPPPSVPATEPPPPAEAETAAAPEPSPPPSSARATVMSAARPDVTQAAAPAAADPVSPAPAAPRLVADTTALDAAAAAAFSGQTAAAPTRAAPLVPSAVVPTPHTGPVVIGGAGSGVVKPASGSGPVVIGGPRGAVSPIVAGAAGGGPRTGPTAGVPAGTPVAVIQFDFGSTGLDARDRSVIRQVADLHARQGGFVTVVGHSSRFTANMPRDRHMLVNFETSVARAETVARALRAEGVAPEVLEVRAVGARQPVYQEVMPAGRTGNQRVEIYLTR